MNIDKHTVINIETSMEKSLKILVIGESGVGKTSFIRQYVDQQFSSNYKATIGVDFLIKRLPWEHDFILKLHFWDIAGQDRFATVTRVYYQKADACIIMFDLTNYLTFQQVAKWKQDLDHKWKLADGSSVPCILLGNKKDLNIQKVEDTEIDNLCHTHGIFAWHQVSVKENSGLDEAVKCLVNKVMHHGDGNPTHLLKHQQSTDTLRLRPKSARTDSKKCQC